MSNKQDNLSEAPFVYGIAADTVHFTDREKETARIRLNFENGINTIVISPRRWGKTSLVNKVVAQMAGNRQLRIVRMDAFSVRTTEDFYRMFATEIIRQTSSKVEEWMENAKRFLTSLVPVVTMSADPMNPVSLSLKGVGADYDGEVLDLPERIAQAKGIRLVICIDEFQQIGEFTDTVAFQKKLRTAWQHQNSVSYCLYGSKRHLLMNMFGRRSYPFYKFGDVIFLERIPLECWKDYIQKQFEQTGRHIDAQLVTDIYNYVDGNSSYMQQLSWLLWTRTTEVADIEKLEDAKEDLLRQNHPLFVEQTNSLTSYQLRFIRAVKEGKAREIGHKSTIWEYGLGSSANIATIKKALQKKELVEIEGKDIRFSDPLFEHWLRKNENLFI